MHYLVEQFNFYDLDKIKEFIELQYTQVGKFNRVAMLMVDAIDSWEVIPFNRYPTAKIKDEYLVIVVFKIRRYHELSEEERNNN